MDRPVQLVLLLVAFFSLQHLDFLSKNIADNSGNPQAVACPNASFGDGAITYQPASNPPYSLPPLSSPGVQILDFQVNRTTFGFADASFTQAFDPSQANKKVALGCDSVQFSIKATANALTINDSLGLRITYGNPNASNSPAQVFDFGNAAVRFTNGGSSFTCAVLPSAVTVSANAGQKTLDVNLHSCLTNLGISLQPGDSIEFIGDFSVNANGPITPQFTSVPNLRAWGYAQQNGALLSCDTLSENFALARIQAIFDFPNTLNGLPIGCEEGELNWRLFVPDNDFSDWFGNEFRPATKVDSLVFDFDLGLLDAFTGGQVEVSIPGHPVFGSAYYPIRPLSDFPDGRYVAKFDTLASIPSLNLVQTYTFDLRLSLKPTCASPTGSEGSDNVYDISSSINYIDRYYAKFIGDGNCADAHADLANSSVAYVQPPSFSLTPVTPVNAPLTNGLAFWDVQICNTASQSDAGLTWLALEDPSGLLDFGIIANVTNPNVPVALNLTPYGQNAFAFVNALQAGQCVTVRIAATTSTCDDVALNIRTGWNCGPFPLGWTPDQNAACSSDFLPLMLINTGVSPVNIAFDEVVSNCAGNGESVAYSGRLTSTTNIANDNYTLFFVNDENGDGIVQTTEPVVAQQLVVGAISPSNPLAFNGLMQLSADEACHILLKVESLVNSVCSSFSTQVPVPRIENAGADRSICAVGGNYVTTLGAFACDTMAGYRLTWNALAPATNLLLDDTTAHSPILTFYAADYPGQTLSFVLATERENCGQINLDTVSILVPADALGVFEELEIALQVADCQSLGLICAEISPLLFPNFVFTDNGSAYAGGFSICAGGFNLELAPGIHELVATDTISGCADTLEVTVTCTSTSTLDIELLLGEMDTICIAGDELSGQILSLVNVCENGQYVDYQLFNDSCLIVTADLVGMETACLVVCDANGFCDTTLLNITVQHPLPAGIFDTLTLTQTGQYCFEDSMLNLTGNLASIQNICPSGSAVLFSVDETGYCIDYQAVAVGVETACVVLCDDAGYCDTVNVTVSVVPGTVFRDTVFLLLETDTFCLPANTLPGTIVSVEDICPGLNGGHVAFTIQGTCILYSGTSIGIDTACIRFEDNLGNVALVELQVSVRKTTPQTFCDTVFVGQSKLYCLDTSELPGSFAEGSIREICPDERTENLDLSINNSGSCVFFEGVEAGVDSSCIVFCDDFGFCDTTYFCWLVKPYFDPPVLGPDVDTTLKGTPIVIDFLANDTIFGGIRDIYVLQQPYSGSVVLNLDNSFTFIPEDGACAHTDVFSYVACNPNGCDTTTVSIFIQCIELTIFTAVSPNNDGVNDVFYIAKIEEFPDNHLWVYNIWGSLVYETTSYRNAWPGTWGADTDLPDGTYYYILEWTDNGVETVQKGYMELFR